MLKSNRKAGFTLLELLIVVIIVSILAAVALPRFSKMTKKARSSEATTAVGSILTAESLYYQEQDKFGNTADLLIDLNTVNFTYTITPTASTNAQAVATGVTGTPAAGIIVTGTINNLGTRTITTTGI